MDKLEKKWFSEINDQLWPGQCFSLKVDKILHHEKSKFQDIKILQTTNHGRALVLDDIIQCTEYDEFAYQEMIAFLPLCAHPDPRQVLIVGGGDGGVAREVHKHASVERITQVEIDGLVVELSKRFLPSMARGFDSAKLQLVVGDGFAYMKQHRGHFDVIITDSSDPVGPAVDLFTESYFALLKSALKPGGIVCSQAGSLWVADGGDEYIKRAMEGCRKHFRNVKYACASVPTYPSGQIGFIVATDDVEQGNCDPAVPKTSGQLLPDAGLRYYDADVHRAAFVLPKFMRKALSS